jgi:hypothetical protein
MKRHLFAFIHVWPCWVSEVGELVVVLLLRLFQPILTSIHIDVC